MYTSDFADIYEFYYQARGKSWVDEATEIARVIREREPDADTLLDVACGTGAHLQTFKELFDHVEGVEISEAMREHAHRRLPDVTVHTGDMRDFDLGRTFAAVTCMFNSIAYVATEAQLRDAIRCMANHARSGGVVVVEPWWFPERFLDGHLVADSHTGGGHTIARMSYGSRQGRASRLEVRFLVGYKDHGIRQFTQTSNLMLFTKDEYLAAFDAADCPAEYVEGGVTGRGLFVGIRK